MSPQETLNKLIAMERGNIIDHEKVKNLLATLRNQLGELEVTDVFSLIHNSRDVEEDYAYWACIHHLHTRPVPEVFDLCQTWAKDISFDKRQAAADLLSQLGYADNYPFSSQSLPIITELLDDSHLEVICSALYACGHLNIGDPTIIAKFINHADNLVRYAVVHAFSSKIDPVSIAGLITLSRDSDYDVRNWATFELGVISEADTPEIRNALFERLSEIDHEIRGEALIGLAKRADVRVLQPLIKELSGEFHGAWCIEATRKMKSAELKPLLVNLKNRLSLEDLSAFGDEIDKAIAAVP